MSEVSEINILVTLNSGYVGPLRVLLRSLCESNPGVRFDVYVAHSSLRESDFKRIKSAIPDEESCRIINTYISPDRFPGLPYSQRWPREACYRIFAAHYLPPDLDRVLYLDPDMAVINRLDTFYKTDLQGNLMAACTHMFGFFQDLQRLRLKMSPGSVYINSGMLLMDLERFRREQVVEDVLDYYEKNKRMIYLFDQDILNGLYHAQTLAVDTLRYNLDEKTLKIYNFMRTSKTGVVNYDWIKKNTAIIHFCSKVKPWHEGYKGKFGELFYTPFAEKIKE